MAVISTKRGERIKLDLYDKKIMFYLSQNSRIPLTNLAKELKLSPQRVKYKVERLKKEILSPAMFLNFPLLEISSYMIFIPKLNEEEIENLFYNESIYFILQSIGEFQWVLNLITEDIETFCKKNLGNTHFLIKPIIHVYADNYNPFHLDIKPLSEKKDIKIRLDEKDYSILKELSRDPTLSLLDLQKKTNIDRQTIKQRMKKIEASNIIQKFRYSINLFKIGFITYLLDIETKPLMKEKVLRAIKQNHYSGFVFENLIGFSMHFLPKDQEELFEFIKSLEKVDPQIKITILQNTEKFKVDLVPKNIERIFEKRSTKL
ncbi:winged helix-turn-helix transcriptional regulator [Candidatus Woesearchaeota archaeon]|nr:winged helix-turn-helix transcriptional regulator [Candidatus Woesearchaeota archaeon]